MVELFFSILYLHIFFCGNVDICSTCTESAILEMYNERTQKRSAWVSSGYILKSFSLRLCSWFSSMISKALIGCRQWEELENLLRCHGSLSLRVNCQTKTMSQQKSSMKLPCSQPCSWFFNALLASSIIWCELHSQACETLKSIDFSGDGTAQECKRKMQVFVKVLFKSYGILN